MQITKKSIDILLSKTLKNETNEDLYFYPPPTVGDCGARIGGTRTRVRHASWPAGWPVATIRFPPELCIVFSFGWRRKDVAGDKQ